MDEYEPMKVLGEGSFGKVYLMNHRRTRELVCTKVIKLKNLPKKEQVACRNEVEVMRRMRHPNIVAYHDSFLYKNCLCIIMEYCDAGDLAGRVNKAKGRLFPESKILTWFVQVALGIHYMHSNHTLHRDIKTQNIFILSSGRVVLGDLGISKVMEGTMDFASTCIGTPYYMSPEIFQNKPYNNKSDVWALGCVLYELTTLKHAFDANSINGLAYKIIKGRYPAPDSRYSRQLRGLIKDMLGTNPKARPDIEQVLRKTFVKNRVAEFTTDLTLEGVAAGQAASLASLRKQLDDLGMSETAAMVGREASEGDRASVNPNSSGRSTDSGASGRASAPADQDASWHRQRRQLEAEEEKRLAAETALQRLQEQQRGGGSRSGGRQSPGGQRNALSSSEWRGGAVSEDSGGSDAQTPGTNTPSPMGSPGSTRGRSTSPTAAGTAAAANVDTTGGANVNGTPKRRNSMLRKLMELGSRGRSGSLSGASAAAAAAAGAAASASASPPPRGESREPEPNRGFAGLLGRRDSRSAVVPDEGATGAVSAAVAAAHVPSSSDGGVLASMRRGSRSPGSSGGSGGLRGSEPPLPSVNMPQASPPPPPGPPPLGYAYRQRGRSPGSSNGVPVVSDLVVNTSAGSQGQALPALHSRHTSSASAVSGGLPEVRERRGSVSPSHRLGGSRPPAQEEVSRGGSSSPRGAAVEKDERGTAAGQQRRLSLLPLDGEPLVPPQPAGMSANGMPSLVSHRLSTERRASVSLSPLRVGSPANGLSPTLGNAAPDEATALWRGRRSSAVLVSPDRIAVDREGLPMAGHSSRSASPRQQLSSDPSADSLASVYDREVSEYLDMQARAHAPGADDDIHQREALLREQLRLAEMRCQELRQTLQSTAGARKSTRVANKSAAAAAANSAAESSETAPAPAVEALRRSGEVTLGQVCLTVSTGRRGSCSGQQEGANNAYALSLGDEGQDIVSSDGYESSDEPSPYGPSHLGTIEDPATPVGRLVDRVNFLRQRCIEGLGKECFETAFGLLKALADDGAATVVHNGQAYSGTDDDQVQELLVNVIGRDKLSYWNLMDQLLLLAY